MSTKTFMTQNYMIFLTKASKDNRLFPLLFAFYQNNHYICINSERKTFCKCERLKVNVLFPALMVV